MDPLKSLYVHHVNSGSRDSKKVRRLWEKLYKELSVVPESQREEYLAMLDDYHSAVEYQGFTAGFITAFHLCRRCYRE